MKVLLNILVVLSVLPLLLSSCCSKREQFYAAELERVILKQVACDEISYVHHEEVYLLQRKGRDRYEMVFWDSKLEKEAGTILVNVSRSWEPRIYSLKPIVLELTAAGKKCTTIELMDSKTASIILSDQNGILWRTIRYSYRQGHWVPVGIVKEW